jgi:hypothetical protein
VPLARVKALESVPNGIVLELLVVEECVAATCMTSVLWDVMFEDKKGRSDGLELTQTSTHTLLRDRRRIHSATRIPTHTLFMSMILSQINFSPTFDTTLRA